MIKIHHIGYAVNDIENSVTDFKKLGYEIVGDKTIDENRNVLIQFVKNGDYLIELVAPLNDDAPIWNILKKIGQTPYHICYEVPDIHSEMNRLRSGGYLILEKEQCASAIDNRKVVFLFKKNVGIIELIESSTI